MLPEDFTTPRLDEQGRRFVIHEPTGVKYFIREIDHPKGNVTAYSRSANTEYRKPPQKAKAKQQRRQLQSVGDGFARATFIEGSEP